MKIMNKVQLIGSLGIDPETWFTPEVKQDKKFRMAICRICKNKEVESPLKGGLIYP